MQAHFALCNPCDIIYAKEKAKSHQCSKKCKFLAPQLNDDCALQSLKSLGKCLGRKD